MIPARIETYDDLRMAMSFALAGLKAEGIIILDPGCVAKTYPRFWDDLATLHRRFPRPGKQSILLRLSQSMEAGLDLPLAEPGDGGGFAVEGGLAEDRVVAPAAESDAEAVVLDRHRARGLDEPAVQLLRVGLLEPVEA